MQPFGTIRDHLRDLRPALDSLADQAGEVEEWGRHLAHCLDGGRLLVAGNGGSAAEAQHLTAELVGRFENERRPLSALVLHGDTSTVTAVCNDYGHEEVFARQVQAHGRRGDVLLLLSTSGRSSNLLCAADVVVYGIYFGGHTWPGHAFAAGPQLGQTTLDIDATALTWEFFEAHPKPEEESD